MSDGLDYEDEYLENPDDDANENGANADEDELDPVVAKKLEALLAERAKAFEAQYKGLQRSHSAKDREILALRKQLEESGHNIEEASEAFQWVAETVLGALPDDARTAAELAFRERSAKLATRRLEKARNAPPPQQQASGDDDVPDWIRERIQKFVNVARKSATRAGVDPDDKSLDYGSDDEGLVERLEKFEDSLAKAQAAKKDSRLERVRQTKEPVATRSSGGGSNPGTPASSYDSLQAGAAKRIADMRSGKFG